MIEGTSLLAGSRGRTGGKRFRAVNPATKEPLAPEFHEASSDEAARALDAAAEAFATFRATTGEQRARLLDTIAAEIEKLGDTLIERAVAESGLPLARIQGERGRTCAQLRLFAALLREGSWVDARIDPALPDRKPLPRPDIRRMLIPLGPVVVFGSSNFPLAFSAAGGDTASALAAGCPVVVKAHRAHPGTDELVGIAVQRAIAACGLPPGTFSLVHGGGSTVGIAMVRHPATTAVGFTGSREAGRALFDAAAGRPHPITVFAEMSSLNPVFLLPAALRERGPAIAKGLLGSFTLGVGQFCTKPGLVFALGGADTERFLQALNEAVCAAPCGTMLTSGIHEAFLRNRQAVLDVPGVTVLCTGTSAAEANRTEAQPSVATVSAATFLRRPELALEAFGPFTLVVQADSPAEIAACASALEGQLTATLHGTQSDLADNRELIAVLEQKAGRIICNGFPTGVEVCHAMHHGGPYPATTDVRFTSVGTAAMLRFVRPVCYQDVPEPLLPDALRDANPLGIMRLVDGVRTRDPLGER